MTCRFAQQRRWLKILLKVPSSLHLIPALKRAPTGGQGLGGSSIASTERYQNQAYCHIYTAEQRSAFSEPLTPGA